VTGFESAAVDAVRRHHVPQDDGRQARGRRTSAFNWNADGKREVLGLDVVTGEDGAGWLAFLRGLVARGLAGVQLAISDAHPGLRAALAATLAGAGWQRCRTHFMRNLLTKVPLTTWGSYGSGTGQMANRLAVAPDDAGNVYVGDSGNYRIEKFDATGSFITAWGTAGPGPGQLGHTFYRIATHGTTTVYVADTNNNRVQHFDSSGVLVGTWGDQRVGGEFNSPVGITSDASGNIYVADSGNDRVQKFDGQGTFLTMWGSSGTGEGQFGSPNGIATDQSGNVYVADYSNSRIQKFDSTGTFITTWGSSHGAMRQTMRIVNWTSSSPGGATRQTKTLNSSFSPTPSRGTSSTLRSRLICRKRSTSSCGARPRCRLRACRREAQSLSTRSRRAFLSRAARPCI
jgi:streptogramin lyase